MLLTIVNSRQLYDADVVEVRMYRGRRNKRDRQMRVQLSSVHAKRVKTDGSSDETFEYIEELTETVPFSNA